MWKYPIFDKSRIIYIIIVYIILVCSHISMHIKKSVKKPCKEITCKKVTWKNKITTIAIISVIWILGLVFFAKIMNTNYLASVLDIQKTQKVWDLVIDKMTILPDTVPVAWTNNDVQQIQLSIRNISKRPVSVPRINWENKFLLDCNYDDWWKKFFTKKVDISFLPGNSTIKTNIDIAGGDIYHRYSKIGLNHLQCTIITQQQQWVKNPNPNNKEIINESDWTNNTFELEYKVIWPSSSEWYSVVWWSTSLSPSSVSSPTVISSVHCSDPENVLACTLWLASCPTECTTQSNTGDCSAPVNLTSCTLWLETCPLECRPAESYTTEMQSAFEYAHTLGLTAKPTIQTANAYWVLTRANMAKMIVTYAEQVFGRTPDTSLPCAFDDLSNQVTSEMASYIIQACQLGIMWFDEISDTAFYPNDIVTKWQFGTFLSRAIWWNTNNGGTPYYANHLLALKDAGIISTTNNVDAPQIRWYAWMMMQRAKDLLTTINTANICDIPENAAACSLWLASCPAECMTQSNTVDCTAPVNVLACTLWLASCPTECLQN